MRKGSSLFPPGVAAERNRASHDKYKKSAQGKRTSLKSALKIYYGITLEEYDAMLLKQEGHCALCLRTEVMVDHDHLTGRFRGLLCRSHNVALGALGDDVDGLQRALDYLERG